VGKGNGGISGGIGPGQELVPITPRPTHLPTHHHNTVVVVVVVVIFIINKSTIIINTAATVLR